MTFSDYNIKQNPRIVNERSKKQTWRIIPVLFKMETYPEHDTKNEDKIFTLDLQGWLSEIRVLRILLKRKPNFDMSKKG